MAKMTIEEYVDRTRTAILNEAKAQNKKKYVLGDAGECMKRNSYLNITWRRTEIKYNCKIYKFFDGSPNIDAVFDSYEDMMKYHNDLCDALDEHYGKNKGYDTRELMAGYHYAIYAP